MVKALLFHRSDLNCNTVRWSLSINSIDQGKTLVYHCLANGSLYNSVFILKGLEELWDLGHTYAVVGPQWVGAYG